MSELKIPKIVDVLNEITKNRYLSAIIQLCHNDESKGYRGVDCYNSRVESMGLDDTISDFPDTLLSLEIEQMTVHEKISVIPFLLRFGYSVAVHQPVDDICPFTVDFPGSASSPFYRKLFKPHKYYYPTSPGILRMRAFLRCLPKLIAWKWRAVIVANHPSRPGGKKWIQAISDVFTNMHVPVLADGA